VSSASFDLIEVLYDSGRHDQLIADIVGDVYHATEGSHLALADSAKAEITARALRFASVRMKHAAFAAEDEWRLVTNDFRSVPDAASSLPRFRATAAGRIVPYQEFRLPPESVVGVTLGYAVPMEPSDPGLRCLLRATLTRDVPVKRSSVMVRD
jgi:hypothetical protein